MEGGRSMGSRNLRMFGIFAWSSPPICVFFFFSPFFLSHFSFVLGTWFAAYAYTSFPPLRAEKVPPNLHHASAYIHTCIRECVHTCKQKGEKLKQLEGRNEWKKKKLRIPVCKIPCNKRRTKNTSAGKGRRKKKKKYPNGGGGATQSAQAVL